MRFMRSRAGMESKVQREMAPLPLWSRFLLSTVIPSTSFFLAVYWWLGERYRDLEKELVRDMGSGGIVLGWILVGFLLIAFALPIALCTLGSALPPWKRWYTSLSAGFIGIVVGIATGGTALFIIHLLTRAPR